eukprot:jgi/Botrbrau1/17266/Bobra.0015s0025.1
MPRRCQQTSQLQLPRCLVPLTWTARKFKDFLARRSTFLISARCPPTSELLVHAFCPSSKA